ncbi:MAG: hypothetical protein HZB51_28685 [Chloroflexi bacterium]|nr:hypothetical protein [Chloroflexota bacterium]
MKKSVLIVGGIVVLVAMLAGAAFVGAQFLAGQGQPAQASQDRLTMMSSQGGKPGQHIRPDIQPAKELPQTPADVTGVFDHRKDNSIFVGTGNAVLIVDTDQNGKLQSSSSHDGPVVEVVVSSQIKVYRDVTARQYPGGMPSGKIQQVVEQGSLDEASQPSRISAWGKKTGDRIIANVIVYSLAGTAPSLPGTSGGGG